MLEELGVLQRKQSNYVQESNLQNLEHRSTTEHEFCDTRMFNTENTSQFLCSPSYAFPSSISLKLGLYNKPP
jgi:hypothetical protein